MWLWSAAAGVAAAAGLGTHWWLMRMSLPRGSGTLELKGLKAPVEVIRDRWGIPHLYGQSLTDVYAALGYVHGQDRLWQLELNRRLASGRLAEIFGDVALPADRFLRRMGMRRAAEAEVLGLDAAERVALEAYCRGVNAAMDAAAGRLPLEMRLLGIRPAPWQPVDTLAWAKVMSLSLMGNWEEELLRYKVLRQVGPEMAARLEAYYSAGQPLTTVPGGLGAEDPSGDLLQLFEAAKPFLYTPAGASNNWVVAGHRTETGKPLLANDPHLALQVPSIWYEAHLVCPETEVTGATLPGVPGVMLGHNRHVAWGMTASCADQADLFIERLNAEETASEFDGRWEPLTIHKELIKVKGKPDVTETVGETRHGPIVAGGPLGEGPAMALRWAALDPAHAVRAVMNMNNARSGAEFRAALADWPTPSMNVVYADTGGNIGYLMAGWIPMRKAGSGFTPVPGWTGEYDWNGWVPLDELPQVLNPESGYIVTANNKVVDGSYPHHISWDYMTGYRAERIQERLKATEPVSVQDCADLQMEVYSIPGRAFAEHCRGLSPTDPLERQALQALLDWDGQLTPASVGGTVYEATLHFAVRRAYLPALGPELTDLWLGKGGILSPASLRVGRSTSALLRELDRRDPAFLGAAGESNPWGALLAASLTEAVAHLKKQLGPNLAEWQWGRLHRLKLAHPMGAVKPLHMIFNGPEVPIGGDMSTPLQTAQAPQDPAGAVAWGPSYRQVVDLADLRQSVSVHPTGQSGHPGSRHYMDLFPLWNAGKFHPMLFARDDVNAHAEATLRLTP